MSRFTSEGIDRAILQLQKSVERSATAGRCVRVHGWRGPLGGVGWERGDCGSCVEGWSDGCCGRSRSRNRHRFCHVLSCVERVTTSNCGQTRKVKIVLCHNRFVSVVSKDKNTDSLYHRLMITRYNCTHLSWGRRCRSRRSSFHSTHTWSRTGISSANRRSHTDPHRTLKKTQFVSLRNDTDVVRHSVTGDGRWTQIL